MLSVKYCSRFILAVSVLLGTLGSSRAQMQAAVRNDETVKSYFLLKLNLETDPVDLQNYFDALAFKADFQAFSNETASRLGGLSANENQLMKWAIADGLNGDLDQSMKQFHQLVVLSAVRGDKTLLAAIYGQMSRMMELKVDFSRAISYAEQGLAAATGAKNGFQQARAYQQLGKLKCLEGRYAEAETDLLKKALPSFTRLKNQAAIADCYREIANLYLRQGLFTQSNWFYLQYLQTAKKAAYAAGIIDAIFEIAQYKYDTRAYAEAAKDWQEAERVAIKSHELPQLLKLKYALNRVYRQLGQEQQAARYTLEFEQLRDILLNPVL